MAINRNGILMTAVICVAVSVLSLVTYDRFFATKIVALDTTTYLKEVQTEYVKGKMSDEELDKRLTRIKDILNKQPSNSVVINAEVVMRNAQRIEP